MDKTKMLQAIATIECEAVEKGVYHKLKRNINGLKCLLIKL